MTANGQRLIQTAFNEKDKEHVKGLEFLYQTHLAPGVNRVEVEVVAAPQKGKGDAPNGGTAGVEVERCTIFVNVLRG